MVLPFRRDIVITLLGVWGKVIQSKNSPRRQFSVGVHILSFQCIKLPLFVNFNAVFTICTIVLLTALTKWYGVLIVKTEPTANLVTSLILMLCHSDKLFRANFRVNFRFILQQYVEVSISFKKTLCEISFHRHVKGSKSFCNSKLS